MPEPVEHLDPGPRPARGAAALLVGADHVVLGGQQGEAGAGRRYDLVLVDPPYEMFSSLQNRLSTYLPAVLADDGLVVVETDSRTEPELPPFHKRTSRRYGSARISLFEHA